MQPYTNGAVQQPAARLFVWLGGGLFVLSLAVGAWAYATRFDAASGGGAAALAFDAALVSVFALHHSLFARETVKRRLTFIPAPLVRSVYVWIASALFIAVCVWWQPIGGELYDVGGVRSVAHAAVQLAGVALIVRSVARIDALELAGIRNAVGHADRREPLQVSGPYRFVRHPLYLGWMLVVFGAAHMTADRLAFAALTSAYLCLAIPFEERSLTGSFGNDYVRYTRAVRWRIVPYIY